MLELLRIRRNAFKESNLKKYLLFAIGEILLVVIGILIALQIDNLNQKRIDRASEKQLYSDLLINLQEDSIAILKIIDLLQEGIECQEYFINTSFPEIFNSNNKSALQDMVFNTRNGVLSFFPQDGVYNSIIANNDIRLIKSIEIKAKLLDLYDYKYKRYENGDIVMENYYQYDVSHFFSAKLGLIAPFDDSGILKEIDLDLMESNYEEYRELLGYIYPHTYVQTKTLINIQTSIKELISLLKKEIDSI
jgi:hypothetical protein